MQNNINALTLKGNVIMDTKEMIIETWKEVLRTDELDLDSNIMDIGGDSYTIQKICYLAREKFSLSISPMDVIMYPNVNALAGFVENGANPEASDRTVRPVRRRRAK